MVAGLVVQVMVNGLGFFWPSPVVRLTLTDGKVVMGQVTDREAIPTPGAPAGTAVHHRVQLKVGNRDLYGADFVWVDEAKIAKRETPADAVMIQRREWGNLYGFIKEVRDGGQVEAAGRGRLARPFRSGCPETQRVFPRGETYRKEGDRLHQFRSGADPTAAPAGGASRASRAGPRWTRCNGKWQHSRPISRASRQR